MKLEPGPLFDYATIDQPPMAPVRTIAPTLHLWSLEEVKLHLRVDGVEEDDLITSLLAAVTGHLDGWTGILGRCLLTQTWRQDLRAFPCEDRLRLPFGPVTAVSGITYRDTSNVQQTLATSVYAGPFADAIGSYIILQFGQVWPSTYPREDAVAVTFVAGAATAAAVPSEIREAARRMIGDLYENRETVVIGAVPAVIPMSPSVRDLLSPYRTVGF